MSQEKLFKLAALRLQYLDGDCNDGSHMYALSNDSVHVQFTHT